MSTKARTLLWIMVGFLAAGVGLAVLISGYILPAYAIGIVGSSLIGWNIAKATE